MMDAAFRENPQKSDAATAASRCTGWLGSADLNQIYFYQAVNKNKDNPPPWVLRRAAPHLGVTYVELLMAAGYLGEDDLREFESRAEARAAGASA